MRRGLMVALALAVAACSSGSAPPFTVKVDDAYPPNVVNMSIIVDSSTRDGRLIEAAGQAVEQVGQEMIAGKPPIGEPFEIITFTVRAPKGAGDSSTGPRIIHLSFDAQTLREAVHMGMDADAILASNTEFGWWTPSNDDVINSYCLSHAAGAFCERVDAKY